ncbi:MAG: hypothetical protein ACYDCK_12825 [Thermoplasmatota archaeon]
MALKVALRTVFFGVWLLIVESVLFGASVLPGLLFAQYAISLSKSAHFLEPYGGYFLVAVSLVPAYYIFCIFFMFLSAGACKLFGWRTIEGEYSIHDANPNLVKWASYNATIQLVRIFAGEFMRTTPLWTLYLKACGAKIAKGVYVNTAKLNDVNLLVLKEKCVIGGDAKLIAHLVEQGRVKASRVVVGAKSVIGVNSVVGPGVEIGDGSAVGAMSFVPKFTKIPPGEAWGGVPARRIKKYGEGEFEKHAGVPVAY